MGGPIVDVDYNAMPIEAAENLGRLGTMIELTQNSDEEEEEDDEPEEEKIMFTGTPTIDPREPFLEKRKRGRPKKGFEKGPKSILKSAIKGKRIRRDLSLQN